MRITLLPLVLFALTAGPSFARAQNPTGQDDCNNGPDVIFGLGTFNFDNSNATTGTEGQSESLCYQFGSSAIDSDVWFSWTAPTTSTFIVETCQLTTIDTKIAAYPISPAGPCPAAGAVLDCNDDNCAFQSQITFSGTAGSSYLFQIGTFPGAQGGSGTFNISSSAPPPPSNDDCNTPDSISGLGTFNFDNSNATTGTEGQNEPLCTQFGSSTIDNDVWFAWTAPTTSTFIVETCLLTPTIDTKIAAYPISAAGPCPAAGSVLDCNDDSCALQSQITFQGTAGSSYMFQIGTFPGATGGSGTFNISSSGPPLPTFGQNYGVGYSGDYKGPLHGQMDVNGNTIYESDLVRPSIGIPQLGGVSLPEILLSGDQLGLTPACTLPGPCAFGFEDTTTGTA